MMTGEGVETINQYESLYIEAERVLADALQVELDEGEHFGDDWVLTPDESMLDLCRQLVQSNPSPMVLVALVGALRGSYHRRAVHELITEIAMQSVSAWRAGDRSIGSRALASEVPQAFAYGVKEPDTEFVLEMWGESAFAAAGNGDEEDFRAYWSFAAAKLKDPRVAEFARHLIRNDLGRWIDYRLLGALRIVGKAWSRGDDELCQHVAQEHPDAEMRRDARLILKRHGVSISAG